MICINDKFGWEDVLVLKLLEFLIWKEGVRVMSLVDGIKKMFKFDELELSCINLLDLLEMIKKKVKKCKIDF